MPDDREYAPLVRVTTYGDWNQFASWWWNLIRKQVRVSPAMKAKIAELTAGKQSEMDKIAAIYEFVTTDVRYKAWEFGVHGYKPYSTDVIFERRHGDCKDKALLLTAMLGDIGVEAYPVLINAEVPHSADDLSLAMVQLFNHCISYLPPSGDRPAMFLDGTATWHPPHTLPEMDRGASVLVVKAGKADLQDIGWPDPAKNVAAEQLAVELAPNGDAKVTLVDEPRMNQAVPLREYLGNEPGERRDNMERYLTRTYGNVKLRDLDVSDPLDLDQPLRVQATFDVDSLAPPQGQGLALKPVFDAQPMQRFTGAPKRDYPLLLGVPESETSVVRYKLPAGWAPVELPPPVKLDSQFGAFELSWSFDKGELRAERKRVLKSPRIETAEYPDFREFAGQVDAAESRTVVVREESR